MYQALYRKWRPRTFDDVVGQKHITETLKTQVRSERLSHAYLFIGTRGTGKTTCAKILSRAVNCAAPVNGNPCNNCQFCRGIEDGSLLDVVEMDAASNNGVDNVRQLRDEAVFSPAVTKKRVYIIDEVHMLSVSAFNALLKILEEPPEHLMFILATTELNKVPATILSRCQRHSFKRLDTASVVGRLQYVAEQEQIALTPDAATLIAGLAEGGMRDALSILDQCSGRESVDTETVYSAMGLAGRLETAELLRCIAAQDSARTIELFHQLWQDGKNPATVLGELSDLMRDVLMCIVAPKGGQALLSGGYDTGILNGFRDAFSSAVLLADISLIQGAINDMKTGQARTVCEVCLITLCSPGLNDSLPMLRARVEALERRVRDGVPARSVPPGPAQVPVISPPSPKEFPPLPEEAPPLPEEAPPFPEEAPPFPEEAPPFPEEAPPFPEEAPPPFFKNAAPISVATSQKSEAQRAEPDTRSETPVDAEKGAEAVSAEQWEEILQESVKTCPPGLASVLMDRTQVHVGPAADGMMLYVVSDFARYQLDRPDVLARLSSAASAVVGRQVRVQVSSGPAAQPKPDVGHSKLDELAKFPIVQFK